jgi:hypothetical protein
LSKIYLPVYKQMSETAFLGLGLRPKTYFH